MTRQRDPERGIEKLPVSSVPYPVWSPYGLQGCQPTSGSFLRLSFAILHAQPAPHQHRREGDVPVMLSKRPESFAVARVGSSVRDASEYHLRGITVR